MGIREMRGVTPAYFCLKYIQRDIGVEQMLPFNTNTIRLKNVFFINISEIINFLLIRK